MYSNELICNILDYIDTFINTKITVDDLENTFFYNRYYIMKLFKKEIGLTIIDYINKVRVYNSIMEINEYNNLLIKVAVDNGFYSLEYFSEIFKKEVGMSPKQFQKAMKNKYSYDDRFFEATRKVIMIKNLIVRVNTYKQNRMRTVMPVKKLSIFDK